MSAVRAPSLGFTLIELVITVTIIGILAAIAYPSYTNYVTQVRRADGQITLTRAERQLERFRAQCSRYPTNAEFSQSPINTCQGPEINTASPDGHYTLTYDSPNPCPAPAGGGAAPPAGNCYTLTVNPVGRQLAGEGKFAPNSRCTALTLNHRGVKGAKDGAGNDAKDVCWKS